ncbi:DUF2335 domain-containing protein [Aeromonas hydrophila]|uniref:DUF2335 domain-containing protein n=1 Tax=Aeromonas hydrophila TaxID=644 RepID=UPI001C5AA79D|nr:DUF2335 domain-containing protein [Aeromonas hydrophila]MBW3809254.1 DUF2335 domain-containing protein [Aeromonas hydrophila]UCM59219.1 DUF2335 domain-containing protein [Aeromonas hydrophila]
MDKVDNLLQVERDGAIDFSQDMPDERFPVGNSNDDQTHTCTDADAGVGAEAEQSDLEAIQLILREVPESLLMQEVASRVEKEPSENIPKMVRQVSAFQGPLPPPVMLAQYEDICPGFADRIVSLTERQQGHRIDIESRSVTASIWNERLGQIFAFIICMFTLASSVWLISKDFAWSGSLLAGGTMTGLAYIFITGRKQNEKSSDE